MTEGELDRAMDAEDERLRKDGHLYPSELALAIPGSDGVYCLPDDLLAAGEDIRSSDP